MNHTEDRRLAREEWEGDQHKPKRGGSGWTYLVAKWMLVPFLLFLSLVVGLMIGYGVLGKQPISEVFNLHTYKHMYDLIFSGT